jgi:hypothetical protein
MDICALWYSIAVHIFAVTPLAIQIIFLCVFAVTPFLCKMFQRVVLYEDILHRRPHNVADKDVVYRTC